ncbi:MerR family transcriptional regulator [Paraburkholderia oxyphila]|uniref:MerR family transcriptional regulator n=1 Tax=Paraburkholderia oxyphila TaxID=614212 RepID=UPI001C3F34B3|nr:MerR family transcriptional regulator [Paraburkholderia oxyphila]
MAIRNWTEPSRAITEKTNQAIISLDLECTRSPTIVHVVEGKHMKIGDLASVTGLSVHTIRYYERIGLIPFALRDASGQRAYDRSILDWLAFLGRLKKTGMPIQGMLRYAQLRAQGAATEGERCELLVAHREAVRAHIAELQSCLLALDAKIEGYSTAPSSSRGKTHAEPHESAESGQPTERSARARRGTGKPARARPAHARGD